MASSSSVRPGPLVLDAGPLLEAFRFLTVLPLGRTKEVERAPLGRSAAYFPLVGVCLGVALVGLDLVLEPIFSVEVRTVLALASLAVLSGGLHLDGLMDSCDGLFGGRDPSHRLQIMRDSRLGSFGAVGGIAVLLLQFACLVELSGALRLAGLVGMAALGRWAMVYAVAAFPAARAEGMGQSFKSGVGRREVVFATLTALVAILIVLGPIGLLVLGVAWAGAHLAATFALSRVPGLTGDLYGAINETTATLVLLCLAVLQMRVGG